ncbi:MAG: tetratricopeptide repeat protein, partial [Myxococcota bacterium]
DEDGWVRAVEDTLERSPRHAAARILLAEKAFAEEDGTRAERLAREVVGAELVDGEPLSAAAGTRAAAWTQLGRIREQGGQRGRARAAYERALEADPYRVGAQLGMGRVLLTERQFSDALARFRAALEVLEAGERDAVAAGEARPEVAARIGTVQALVALDRVREARDTMTKLLQDHPEDPRVVLWVGKTAEADDDTEAAEERYREVIRMAPKDFAGYLALAQLFFEKQRPADAAAALRDARDNVPETAEMRRMLGESELRRGRYDRAIEGFERALELEPGDTSSLFGIGVAHQRADRLDEAARVLDDVAERDPSYPGLALERGRIYEARGRAERAARSYREALEKRPGDLDLMLRLGAALVASDDIDEAEEIVEKVTRERTHSAEAEYLLGRVALKRDRPDDALAHFERAVQIDGTRGELHLYRARALLEQGSLARAHKAVEAALERDSDLGDAYWVRGELRLRSGAVKDAAADFEKALELNPERLAAHAGMGESYDQLGKRRDAIRAYEAALEHDDSRGDWWYRLGRLQLDAGQRKRASETLSRAIELGDASESAPGWLADAHRLQGDTFRARRQRRKAIAHYRRYLEVAPEDAVDRQEVERKLRELD